MAIIIASLGLFTALVAVWLCSTTLSKMEAGNKELKQKIMAEINDLRTRTDKRLSTAENRVSGFNEIIGKVTQEQAGAEHQMERLRAEVERMRGELDDVMLRMNSPANGAGGGGYRRDFG